MPCKINNNRRSDFILISQKCIRCKHWEKPPQISITAYEVKELREYTGAGMYKCKQALTIAGGDREVAIEYLRCADYACIANCGNFEQIDD